MAKGLRRCWRTKMIKQEWIFEDVNEMNDQICKYLELYNPAGYDTEMNISVIFNYEEFSKTKKVKYRVLMTRLESCD
jgi:hypothetical protein